jgi:hypothetical protein
MSDSPASPTRIRPETCSVVDQFCLYPANIEFRAGTTIRCFACGQPVCRNCSLMAPWYPFGTKRICHNCLREEPRGYPAVFEHLYALAGYPPGVGAAAAAELIQANAAIKSQRGPRRPPAPRSRPAGPKRPPAH